MLARTPLAQEIANLKRALENAEPPYVRKAREALVATREKRALVAQRYDAECALVRQDEAMRPTAQMLALEQELADINQKIEVQRFELLQARNDWRPSFKRTMAHHVDAALPMLENTMMELRAVAQFFEVYDDYIRDNGIVLIAGLYTPSRMSNSMYDMADRIKRFLAARSEEE